MLGRGLEKLEKSLISVGPLLGVSQYLTSVGGVLSLDGVTGGLLVESS